MDRPDDKNRPWSFPVHVPRAVAASAAFVLFLTGIETAQAGGAHSTPTAAHAPEIHPPQTRTLHPVQMGFASWYGRNQAGRQTANGDFFDPNRLTAAHRTLPLGTRIRVTRMATGDSVIVTVTDRGPFVRGRILDLSPAAARHLRVQPGQFLPIRIEVVSLPQLQLLAAER